MNTNAIGRFLIGPLMMLPMLSAAGETIPLEDEHGTYRVTVRINDSIMLPFVLDTGASDVAIPADVFLTLQRTGTVEQRDFIGKGTYVLADGTEQPSDRFVLHELKVGQHIVKNVIANVTAEKGDPLLGQSFLSHLPLWALDNTHHVLIVSDGNDVKPRSGQASEGYGLFVSPSWIMPSRSGVTPEGSLVFRRYAFRQDLNYMPNIMNFFVNQITVSIIT